MSLELKFYDLPVYRVDQRSYNDVLDAKLHEQTETWRLLGTEPPKHVIDSVRQHLYEKYGPWQFNEIVGFIRLHFLGTQIRGEYFSAEKKRTLLTRKKVFTYRNWKLDPEKNVHAPRSSGEIWQAIQQYVDDCRAELKKGRHIDDSMLNVIGPHVDWLTIFQREL